VVSSASRSLSLQDLHNTGLESRPCKAVRDSS
jgi:hypothetical protein